MTSPVAPTVAHPDPADDGPWLDAVQSPDGEITFAGRVLTTQIDEPWDDAVRHGAARFLVENRGTRTRVVRPRELRLLHPEGCRAPARNPKGTLRVVDVNRVESDDVMGIGRDVPVNAGERVVLEIVFPTAQGHPRTCKRTRIRVLFVVDKTHEFSPEAEWRVERVPPGRAAGE